MNIPLNYHDNGRYHGAWNIIYNYEQHFLYQLHHLHKYTVLGSPKSLPQTTKGSSFGCVQLSLGVVAETSSRLVTSGSQNVQVFGHAEYKIQ